jgi:hypothetical protein
MDTHELAWAAGFFDGEGHIGASNTRRDIYLSISQIDRRVLDRFRDAIGVGRVYGPYEHPVMKSRKNEQPRFYFQCQSYQHVQAIAAMLWKWLSPVKREQVSGVLGSARKHPIGLRLASRWKTCRRGHPRTPENVKIVIYKGYETRRCVACLRERGVRFQRQAQMVAALLEA